MSRSRQALAARVWGPNYRTWFPFDSQRQRKRAKRRSAKRERQRSRELLRSGGGNDEQS